MELGMIGLGRMGGSMVQRLLGEKHRVVVYDMVQEAVAESVRAGAAGAASLQELVARLNPPRAVWVMVPSGKPTEDTIESVSGLLSPGDTVLDGGNSYYKDSVRRARDLAGRGLNFIDVGTSGGIWGLEHGYCLMIGGRPEDFRRLEPVFRTLAPSGTGYAHVGPVGAGHYVKMVHNGIEYGLMEAYAEGFELLEAKKEFGIDLRQVAEVWGQGSVVRSWLLELTAAALKEDPGLKGVQAYVEDSGEGRWTVQESLEMAVPVPALTLALYNRFRSRQEQPFGARLLAALRKQFGGHAVRKA